MEDLLRRIYGSQFSECRKLTVRLPLYLTEGCDFYRLTIMGVPFVLVRYRTPERLNVSRLKKYAQKYCEYFSEIIVYGFSKVSTSQRMALIENSIAFIAENEQVFLPFLGSYFRRCEKESMTRKLDKFSPTAQLLMLFILYNRTGMRFSKSEAAKKIGTSSMTVTRAVKDLIQIGILQEEKVGTEVLIFSDKTKADIWEIGKPYLINPVQNSIYVAESDKTQDRFLKAGEYSLADRSMLGYPRFEEYALEKGSAYFDNVNECDPNLDTTGKLIRIQRWKYDPKVLGNHDMVDPISLICSFQGEEDERIQMSLDEVQGEIDTWQLMMN